jgi:phosphoglycolate phosphatase
LNKKTIIFDLDGTLIDSIKDIAICCNQVLKKNGYKTHEIKEYNYFAGAGIRQLVKNALPEGIDESKIDELTDQMKAIYSNAIHENTKPYDGIEKLLKDLKDKEYSLSILSNKPHNATLLYVKSLFSDIEFDEIHGQKEDVPRKPNPIAAINIAKTLNKEPKNIFFVGDTSIDMQTAKNASMVAVGVVWGFRSEDELIKNGADFIAKDSNELWDILTK